MQSNIDPESFHAIAKIAFSESGIRLVPEKTSMIQSRLRNRLRAIGVSDFTSYVRYLESDQGVSEKKELVSALTTNVSHFFREKHHFKFLIDDLTKRSFPDCSENSIRIWSAGCSNGQEAYSIAITIMESLPHCNKLNIKILATDIDEKVISFAERAVYPERMLSGLDQKLIKKYFTRIESQFGTEYKASNSLKSMVTFRKLNLIGQWPMKKSFQYIFCRNVVIYFDVETQENLWKRFYCHLSPDGYLFLGHSERIVNPSLFGFSTCGPTTYSIS